MSLAIGGLVARDFLEDDLAGLAVGDLGGIDDAGAVLGADHDAVQEDEDRKREVQVQERLGSGELEDAALLIEAVEAGAAQLDQAGF